MIFATENAHFLKNKKRNINFKAFNFKYLKSIILRSKMTFRRIWKT